MSLPVAVEKMKGGESSGSCLQEAGKMRQDRGISEAVGPGGASTAPWINLGQGTDLMPIPLVMVTPYRTAQGLWLHQKFVASNNSRKQEAQKLKLGHPVWYGIKRAWVQRSSNPCEHLTCRPQHHGQCQRTLKGVCSPPMLRREQHGEDGGAS